MKKTAYYYINPLFLWMCSLARYITVFDDILNIFRRYKVGVTSDEKIIYWQHDLQGNCRAGKVMKYDYDGHRNKQYGAQWVHSLMHQHNFNLEQVPFGLHLLPSHPHDCTVAVVESEKTALMAAAYHVAYFKGESRLPLFISTGGAGNLLKTLHHLRGRKVVLFPDEDQSIAWAKIASQQRSLFRSIAIDSTVSKYVINGSLSSKSDYGDLLAWLKKQ